MRKSIVVPVICGIFLAPNFVSATSEINKTTSRYLRTNIMCRVATESGHKPLASGMDNFRQSDHMFGYADLYNDGTLNLISGASDFPYYEPTETFPYQGNLSRSRAAYQYAFYDPSSDFIIPSGTKFLGARTVVQDYNGDGIHDVAFIQSGPDAGPTARPWVPRRNEIMLSSEEGYNVSYLPGPASTYHGGTAGDIDSDGDIDIVVTPGVEHRLVAYINDGAGRFSYREIANTNQRTYLHNAKYYSARLWDIDSDGSLDLLVDGHEELTSIYWGNGSYNIFNGEPTILPSENQSMHDIEFGDFVGDGKSELAILSSLSNGTSFHKGVAIQYVKLRGRNVDQIINAERILLPLGNEYLVDENMWFSEFSACDLLDDGDLDLVYEQHGEGSGYLTHVDYSFDFSRLTRLIWENDGAGNLRRVRIEDPIYFMNYDQEGRRLAAEHAQNYGTTVNRYLAPQIFYPTDDGSDYISFRKPNTPPFLD